MDNYILLLLLICAVYPAVSWTLPFYPVKRAPMRIVRFAPPPPHFRRPFIPVQPDPEDSEPEPPRPKRDHHDYDPERRTSGVTGPVHTFVKTDKNANYKWGVRHHVGNKFAS